MINWVTYTALRHLKNKRREKGDTSSFLSIIGIISGVMTMITVIGVMNGFQGSKIDKRVEISSGHVSLEPKSIKSRMNEELLNNFDSLLTYYKGSEFITAASDGRDSEIIGLQIHSLPQNIFDIDEQFKKWINLTNGKFDLNKPNSIIIGRSLAYSRHLNIGDTIDLISLQSKGANNLNPEQVKFIIKGIYHSGSIEYDESLVFISNNSALEFFVNEGDFIYKFKLKNRNRNIELLNFFNKNVDILDQYYIKTWRDYNVSFYNALKNEKNLMTILIGLIFVVVGINIYNSIRRSVYLRFEEISVLKTMGATSFDIRVVFILESFFIGFLGATFGVLFGLWIVNNINNIFDMLEFIINNIFSLFNGAYISFYGSQFFYLNKVPVEVYLNESIYVYLSAIATSIIAAYIASKRISTIKPGEVIRNE